MKKGKLLAAFDVVSIIGLITTVLVFLVQAMNSIINYSESQSLHIVEVILLNSFVTLFLLLYFIVLVIFLQRKMKQLNIASFMSILNKFINEHKIVSMACALLVFIVLLVSLLVTIQEEMLYFPNHSEYKEQELKNTHKYKKTTFAFDDTIYSGWGKIDTSNTDKQTIIYFGGNAEYSSNTFYYYDQNNWQGLENYNFIMIDYPGFGLSTDEITEENIYKMSLYIFDAILTMDEINPDKIIVMGFSLGTGVASYLSANRDFSKLILLAPYSSMVDVINTNFPIFYGPLKPLVRHEYDTISRVSEMNEETLIIASNDDKVVNIKLTQKLIDTLQPKSTLILDDLGHNDLLNSDEVYTAINSFLNE